MRLKETFVTCVGEVIYVLSALESTEMDVYKTLARPHVGQMLLCIFADVQYIVCPRPNVDNDGIKCHAGSLPTHEHLFQFLNVTHISHIQ